MTAPAFPLTDPLIGLDDNPLVVHIHDDLPSMPSEKERSRIEIILDNPFLQLKGVGVHVEPARLAGHVAVYLTEPTSLKEITLQFRGKARLPFTGSESVSINNNPLSYLVCSHDWSFLEGGKNHSHTLKAGRHLFPFQLRIGGSLPSTLDSRALGGASITYKLRAQAIKAGFGFHNNLHATVQVPIIRSFASEAIEYQQSLEIENSWPEKLMYSIMIPHKAWAAGDQVTAMVRCTTMAKGVKVLNIQSSIQEQTKIATRSGVQESNRSIATVKHNIVHGRIVEAATSRVGQSSSRSTSRPSTPASSSPSSSPTASHQTHPSSGPGLTPLTPIPPTAGPSTDTLDSEPDPEPSDLVTHVNIHIPHYATPSHALDPIQVSHRIRWYLLIANPDGHTSELRCSLPLHVLDHRLLSESRAYSGPTRRLLLGLEEPTTEEEEVFLPSYSAHVRDRVANMYLPESAVVRVANPWVCHGSSPTFGPNNNPPAMALPACLQFNSGSSTPPYPYPTTLFEQGVNQLLAHLPHQPREETSVPLEWINSELLISLSGGRPLRSSRPSTAQTRVVGPREEEDVELISPPVSRRHSQSGSGPASGLRSKLRSRSGSIECDERRSPLSPMSSSSSSSSHNDSGSTSSHGGGIRTIPSLIKNWLPSLSSHSHPRDTLNLPSSLPSPLADSDDGHQRVDSVPTPDPTDVVRTGAVLLHRAFTETPAYAIAARGFIGGVPPLSSMVGLPSYEEAAAARA